MNNFNFIFRSPPSKRAKDGEIDADPQHDGRVKDAVKDGDDRGTDGRDQDGDRGTDGRGLEDDGCTEPSSNDADRLMRLIEEDDQVRFCFSNRHLRLTDWLLMDDHFKVNNL